MNNVAGSALIARLASTPSAFPHETGSIQILETHISWVLLTGSYAYKIKKPVDFGFLDFSTLERRHRFCLEELRLNRRLAGDLYLEVVAITEDHGTLRIGGTSPPLEFAVKMRQFDQHALAGELALKGELSEMHIDDLAALLATFHQNAPRSPDGSAYGSPERIHRATLENFEHLAERGERLAGQWDRVQAINDWSNQAFAGCADTMRWRQTGGHVRECHGDLHLGNLALVEGRLVPFDCIEFNDDLRWIDTINELAFLVMDLEVRGHPRLAFRLLNRYLELSGDYAGLRLFDYYRAYRAMVRAKIAVLSMPDTSQCGPTAALQQQFLRYVAYAEDLIRPDQPRLFITHGFSGCGKSHVAGLLSERLPAIRLRSDVERKRMFRIPSDAADGTTPQATLYGADATRRTYSRLLHLAEMVLTSGLSVIVDATFLKREHRVEQRGLARKLDIPFQILDIHAPESILRSRIQSRLESGADPSDADQDVLTLQMASAEPMGDDERNSAFSLSGDSALDIDQLLDDVGRLKVRPSAR